MSTLTINPDFDTRRLKGRAPARGPIVVRQAPALEAGARPVAGRVRLTRRGRLVVFVIAMLAVLTVGFFAGSGSVATQSPAPTTVVKVEPGQTLWSIAAEMTAEGDDVRDTVYEIQRLNRIDSAALDAGQTLRVPAAD